MARDLQLPVCGTWWIGDAPFFGPPSQSNKTNHMSPETSVLLPFRPRGGREIEWLDPIDTDDALSLFAPEPEPVRRVSAVSPANRRPTTKAVQSKPIANRVRVRQREIFVNWRPLDERGPRRTSLVFIAGLIPLGLLAAAVDLALR